MQTLPPAGRQSVRINVHRDSIPGNSHYEPYGDPHTCRPDVLGRIVCFEVLIAESRLPHLEKM